MMSNLMGAGDRDMVNIGLVGLGYWGPNHLRVVQGSERTKLKWICDTDPERLQRFSNRTRATPTTDLDQLLEDSDTDALIISTPISTHFEIGKRALEAGKHVLIEKPMAGSSVEADELIALADRNGLAIMCGHTFLFSPPVVAVRELINSGELGEIYFISSTRVNLGLHQPDLSVIWDLAPHDFSILLSWLDEVPDTVSAIGRDSILPGTPDVAFANLGYASGLIANVELSWLAPSKLRRTAVVGSKKMVVYDDTSVEQVRVFDQGVQLKDPETFGEHQLSYRTGDILTPHLSSSEPIGVQLNAFVDSVKAGGADPEHTRIARDVIELIEAAEHSLNNDGVRTSLEELRADRFT